MMTVTICIAELARLEVVNPGRLPLGATCCMSAAVALLRLPLNVGADPARRATDSADS